jgi:hypothetical protein
MRKSILLLIGLRWSDAFIAKPNDYRLLPISSTKTSSDQWIQKAFQVTPTTDGVVGPKHAIIYDTTLRGTWH